MYWTDVWGFWVALVSAVASTIIAAFAVWVTVNSAKKEARESRRVERSSWAQDFSFWLLDGLDVIEKPMSDPGLTAWLRRKDELSLRAQILKDSNGALVLIVRSIEVRAELFKIPEVERASVARAAVRLLAFWATAWVGDPNESAPPVDQFIVRTT